MVHAKTNRLVLVAAVLMAFRPGFAAEDDDLVLHDLNAIAALLIRGNPTGSSG